MSNFFKHLKTVLKHKKYVAKYCFMCKLYYQGLVHDLSKFNPIEFFESVKYYEGTRSPIDKCKEVNGYSLAWLHHRGRNRHHWEYWLDNFQSGTTCIKMPFKYALEMVCDFLGAGNAYMGKKFTFDNEYSWWQEKRQVVKLHPDTFKFVDTIFNDMKQCGIEPILKNKEKIKYYKKNYESN